MRRGKPSAHSGVSHEQQGREKEEHGEKTTVPLISNSTIVLSQNTHQFVIWQNQNDRAGKLIFLTQVFTESRISSNKVTSTFPCTWDKKIVKCFYFSNYFSVSDGKDFGLYKLSLLSLLFRNSSCILLDCQTTRLCLYYRVKLLVEVSFLAKDIGNHL